MNKRKQNNYSCCFLAHTKKWENKYKELKMEVTKMIPLSRGLEVMVDADDYIWLKHWKWSCCSIKNPQAVRTDLKDLTRISSKIVMAREIMKTREGEEKCIHLNGDVLDCRRVNLKNVPIKGK